MHRILVIDDEKDVAELLRVFFSTLGFDSTLCHEGKSALEVIGTQEFFAVFCDYKLPDINGAEIFKELKGRIQGAMPHFVLMTGSILDEDVGNLVDSEKIRFLQKPFLLEDLQLLIKELKAG